MATKLRVDKVRKQFRDLQVLEEVSLEVASGEFVSIVGPSGCGKSTFLRIVDGLIAADSGAIELDGQGVRGPGVDRGFVFQADCLLPWRTVWANTFIGLEVNGRRSPADRSRVSTLLELVGLKGFEGYYPRQLSGGMRQRVNLARALAVSPEVLLMDEPFAALDAQTREIMQTELLRIWQAERKTVLFVTHHIEEAVFLSDRVVVFGRRPGRIKEILGIDLPRPRPLGVKREPRFVTYVDRIWKLIEDEVREDILRGGISSATAHS